MVLYTVSISSWMSCFFVPPSLACRAMLHRDMHLNHVDGCPSNWRARVQVYNEGPPLLVHAPFQGAWRGTLCVYDTLSIATDICDEVPSLVVVAFIANPTDGSRFHELDAIAIRRAPCCTFQPEVLNLSPSVYHMPFAARMTSSSRMG